MSNTSSPFYVGLVRPENPTINKPPTPAATENLTTQPSWEDLTWEFDPTLSYFDVNTRASNVPDVERLIDKIRCNYMLAEREFSEVGCIYGFAEPETPLARLLIACLSHINTIIHHSHVNKTWLQHVDKIPQSTLDYAHDVGETNIVPRLLCKRDASNIHLAIIRFFALRLVSQHLQHEINMADVVGNLIDRLMSSCYDRSGDVSQDHLTSSRDIYANNELPILAVSRGDHGNLDDKNWKSHRLQVMNKLFARTFEHLFAKATYHQMQHVLRRRTFTYSILYDPSKLSIYVNYPKETRGSWICRTALVASYLLESDVKLHGHLRYCILNALLAVEEHCTVLKELLTSNAAE